MLGRKSAGYFGANKMGTVMMNWQAKQRHYEQQFLAVLKDNPDTRASDLFFAHFRVLRNKSSNNAVRQFDSFAEDNLALNMDMADLLGINAHSHLADFNLHERRKIRRLILIAKKVSRYFSVPTKGREYLDV